MYERYFYSKTVDKALKGPEYRDENWNSYLFRSINIFNKNTDLSALKCLSTIFKAIDLKNIDRLKNTKDSLELAIILHGLFGESKNWNSIANELASNFEIHLIDQRNHGKSFHHDEHNYIVLAEDIYNYIQFHRLENYIIMGHSMGGKVAMQFAFIFHYPQGDILSGELHVPAGQPISMRMESKDVIHAFWVPEFRLKQDVIPGQPTILNFTPTKPGRYPIISAELCGPYHGGTRSTVVVEDLNS